MSRCTLCPLNLSLIFLRTVSKEKRPCMTYTVQHNALKMLIVFAHSPFSSYTVVGRIIGIPMTQVWELKLSTKEEYDSSVDVTWINDNRSTLIYVMSPQAQCKNQRTLSRGLARSDFEIHQYCMLHSFRGKCVSINTIGFSILCSGNSIPWETLSCPSLGSSSFKFCSLYPTVHPCACWGRYF